jgi:putative transposase
MDNGPEFISQALQQFCEDSIGFPTFRQGRHGYVESFNSRIRDECLNINSFWSLAQACVVIGDWKHEYNHHRRHSSLGYQPPARYAATCTHQ